MKINHITCLFKRIFWRIYFRTTNEFFSGCFGWFYKLLWNSLEYVIFLIDCISGCKSCFVRHELDTNCEYYRLFVLFSAIWYQISMFSCWKRKNSLKKQNFWKFNSNFIFLRNPISLRIFRNLSAFHAKNKYGRNIIKNQFIIAK